MATKYRVYNAKGDVILDNVTAPISIELEAGKQYAAGDFKYTAIDAEGNEAKLIDVPAFKAVDDDEEATPHNITVDPDEDSVEVSAQ